MNLMQLLNVMISKIPIDTDKKIIERYEKGADFIVTLWILFS